MTSSSTARSRPARLRRASASFLLASGLVVAGTAVLPAGVGAASAHASAPADAVVGLRLGNRGPAVKVLQRALIRLGIRIPGGADGVFGARTDWAVRWFQANNGLAVTGVVNEAMANALKIGPGSRPAPAPTPAPSPSGLARGARGPAVVRVQQALIRAGIAVPGGADGIFGSGTEQAVRQFQRRKGLTVTGTVNEATSRALGLSSAPAPAPETPAAQGFIGLKLGSRGTAVKALQQAIIRTGLYLHGGADGVFGLATKNALILVQRTNGLPQTGVVDAATARALKLTTSAPAPSLRRGARGAAVKELQRALMAKGIYVAGGADGIFGPATDAALRLFQRRNGLQVTGTVDQATSSALGLGRTPRPTAPTRFVGLRLGSRGDAVKALQRALMATGMTLYGGADGIFGAATKNALMLFQRTNGLSPTGIVDARTAKLLGLNGRTPAPSPTPTPGPTAPGYPVYNERGPRVVALQTALIRAGIAVPGGADGVFGSATAAAVVQFQRAKGLTPTGRVDAATARRLGLSPMTPPSAQPAPKVRLDARPVQGPCWTADSWLAPRGGGRLHLGVDIIAARGKELYAVTSGRISQVYKNYRGSLAGNGIKIARSDGTYFFYAHLQKLAPGIKLGTSVRAGQVVGWVGATGNAAGPHLHLEIHPGGGAAINPYPAVKAIGAC
jgi:peptidoglycan hydrolase-like protein with peptidoglycan-binding domain